MTNPLKYTRRVYPPYTPFYTTPFCIEKVPTYVVHCAFKSEPTILFFFLCYVVLIKYAFRAKLGVI